MRKHDAGERYESVAPKRLLRHVFSSRQKGIVLIVGKVGKPEQWGIPYNASLEIGRAAMTVGKMPSPVEQVTISIDDTPAGGTLRIEWGNTRAAIPFTVG